MRIFLAIPTQRESQYSPHICALHYDRGREPCQCPYIISEIGYVRRNLSQEMEEWRKIEEEVKDEVCRQYQGSETWLTPCAESNHPNGCGWRPN